MSRVVVVGGGLAGIAAALCCADGGAAVTLLEVRPRLGGAACSYEREGLVVDNGQHVFLRCFDRYRALLDRLGSAGDVVLQERLDIPVLAPDGRRARLARAELPAPFHLAAALARYPLLAPAARLRAARAALALRRLDLSDPALDERRFGDWLRDHGQRDADIEALWDLIALPALNLPAAEASLALAAFVFRRGLLSGRADGDIGYARAPLGEVHGDAGARALAAAGVEVRTRWRVDRVAATEPLAVEGPEGRMEADAVVVAVPHERAAGLLPEAAGVDADVLRRLGRSPILNVHLIYDRPVTELAFAAAVGTPVQYLFDRSGPAGLERGRYLAISVSGAGREMAMRPDELRRLFVPAVERLLPEARSAHLETFFVTREHAATFRAAPGTAALRPGARTAAAGLFLAGAFTDTGWPATMEGAVRSGEMAADAALEHLTGGRTTGSASGRGVLALAPLGIEARAIRRGVPGARVLRTGVGPRRARAAARRAAAEPAAAVAVTGFCGALDPTLEPGDLVLASELRAGGRSLACPPPGILAGALERAGLRVRVGPLASTPGPVVGAARRALRAAGAIAVDMESAWLHAAAAGRPFAVARAVLDTPERELHRPLATAAGTRRAYASLRRAAPVLDDWARAVGPRELVLAAPRAACAGVERAVQAVRDALAEHGAPVYVRRQIVHNAHVVAELEHEGAVFVEEVDAVPEGATVLFSAHGVSPRVREQARERGLRVIDATCPLVAKVHAEARRFAAGGYTTVLVGHAGHEEVEGTLGEAPNRMLVLSRRDEVDRLELRDGERVAYLTQTTLAIDETAEVLDALRGRFPGIVGPPSDDICYATQNRQDAVRAFAPDCDVVLVIGAPNSSNSNRLVEVARRGGALARLIEDERDIDPGSLRGVRRIGLTAGASAPEHLVRRVVAAMAALGPLEVSERRVADERVRFKTPPMRQD